MGPSPPSGCPSVKRGGGFGHHPLPLPMAMADLGFLGRLASCFATQEGRPADFANPGDLRAAPWAKAATYIKGFWAPGSRAEGVAGLYHQLALDIARGATLTQLVEKFAPPTENATDTYLENVAKWMGGLPVDVPLWDYLSLEDARTFSTPSPGSSPVIA